MKHLKEKILRIATKAQEGHIPAAFSCLDLMWVLHDKILQKNDKFILSKGHASIGLYVTLAEKGYFDIKELDNFGKNGSRFGGHPDRTKLPVEASTGSLGNGFPIAVGEALGIKIKKSDGRVYVIVGDGECNEGTIWESAAIAAHHKLNNLYLIVDQNHSLDEALNPHDLEKRFEAFGWYAVSIDGHNHEEICKALTHGSIDKPTAIIAETIKGKGIKIMENNPEWTHKYPTPEQLEDMIKEL